MPETSLALFSRWWQLETWLRQLTYVELRARDGVAWKDQVRAAAGRLAQDAQFTHMLGADQDNPLAYLDFSQLRNMVEGNWRLFEPSLLHRPVWDGRQDELARVRHRIGHVRRPHEDDLGRIEQFLRDLERGTFIALSAYNRRHYPEADQFHDAVTTGWLQRKHSAARRLIDHADRQYETRLVLRVSRRPWLEKYPSRSFAGTAGVLWHATFFMAGRVLDARNLWHDSALHQVRPLLVHMLTDSPNDVTFTFAAVDDDKEIADAIGAAFDAVLMVSHPGTLSERMSKRWVERAQNANYRLLHGTGWNIVDETTVPITSFGAGGGVEAPPA